MKKSYYFSQNYVEPSSVANQICEAFDMTLAKPRDQSEYDNLKNKVNAHRMIGAYFAIAGYRSDNNSNLWLIGGKERNFKPDWHYGEPYNMNGDEHCSGNALLKDRPKNILTDISCSFPSFRVFEIL